MNLEEILKEHPKTAVVVKQWLLDKLLEGLKDNKLPDEFKEIVRKEGITDDKVIGILEGNPRSMFDLFDSHKVYIDISCLNDKFLWGINDDMNTAVYNSRLEADGAAVIEAFKILEAKL